jgi:hypothetical protein
VNFIAYELATTFSELHRKAMDKDRVVDAKEQLRPYFDKLREGSST